MVANGGKIILVILLTVCGLALPAELFQSDSLIVALEREGFENLVVAAGDSEICVGYENRVYRCEIRAAGVVLAWVARLAPEARNLVLVPQNRAVPVARIEVRRSDYDAFRDGKLEGRTFAGRIRIGETTERERTRFRERHASGLRRVDFIVNAGHQIRFGNYDDRFKLYGFFRPGLTTMPWRGGAALVEAIAPFYDDIGLYGEDSRLGRLTLSQVFLLPRGVYTAIEAGAFMPERWGVAIQAARFFAGRRFLIGGSYSSTGFLFYEEGKWIYSAPGTETYQLYGRFFFPGIGLMVGADYSLHLMGDSGPRVMVSRTFGETEIGFYAARTDLDKFGGFQLRIPIPPARRARPAGFRITVPEAYRLDYRATTRVYTRVEPIQTGLSVQTGFDLIDFFKRLTVSTIAERIEVWKTE
ncbi:YjbH domain-containing protein [candidate division KSB1 bacterium]|nr:YjbH domain-containing protein [candidate division KSB1 bacterium]